MTIYKKLLIVFFFCSFLSLSCSNDFGEIDLPSINPVEGYPYFASHLFIDKISANSNAIIPCQSLFDIEIAARLGFPSIELNVHETADGRFVTIHGVKGAFGDQVVSIDGSSVADKLISEVDYNYIKDSIVYRSIVSKYRTTIPTIEEALAVCEHSGISPYICCQYNERLFDIVASYNVIPIWGCYSFRDALEIRKRFDGLITYWSSLTEETEIISSCIEIGPPYVHCIASDILNDRKKLLFSEEKLISLIQHIHEVGCSVGFAGCYTPAVLTNELWSLGFDYASSGWAVNEFSVGDIIQVESIFSDCIITNGSVVYDKIVLNNNDTIVVQSNDSPFLSKGFLSIRINGHCSLRMGNYIFLDIESNGEELTFSTYYLNQEPSFTIVSKGHSEVLSLKFISASC